MGCSTLHLLLRAAFESDRSGPRTIVTGPRSGEDHVADCCEGARATDVAHEQVTVGAATDPPAGRGKYKLTRACLECSRRGNPSGSSRAAEDRPRLDVLVEAVTARDVGVTFSIPTLETSLAATSLDRASASG